MHYIDTFGPSVFAKPHHLAPDGLKIAKKEFQHMLDLGPMRPSKNNYASPLHLVPKKEGDDWRLQSPQQSNQTTQIFHSKRFGFQQRTLWDSNIFTSDVRPVNGKDNIVADALSRIEIDAITTPSKLDYKMIAQEQINYPELEQLLKSNTSLKLQNHYFPLEDIHFICDMSTNQPRSIIPKTFRQIIFENVHFLSNPSTSDTSNLIFKQFIWPKMKSNIRDRVRACAKCQQHAKVFQHTKAPLGTFAEPDAQFSHIHLNFIGPLPISNGKQYCLTIVNRSTRWSEVIPTLDIIAETTERALVHVWISRFERQ
ncbi:pro-Pol polyprotein [Nephila pilipes]|uniref:RNA-directed DNA polymerase n=1 Tax=Nephila pilipes TaxID=299642 RepID=A0A8X6TNH8_NEPPI|nr:pro-Pol polyprotein [Nephila pilipes]